MKGSTARHVDVLLVDDDPGVRESVGSALAEQGACVTKVASLSEARKNLARQQFALVLTDLWLRSGNEGLTVARLAREKAPNARVVLFSGRDLTEVADEAAEVGVDALHQAKLRVRVEMLRPGTYEALVNHLERHGTGYYHVVHFDVHGALLTYDKLMVGEERSLALTICGTKFRRIIGMCSASG